MPETQGGEHHRDATGGVDASGLAGEVFAADLDRNQGRDPRQPGCARNAAREVESEKQRQNQGQLGDVPQETPAQGHQRHAKDEHHPRAPTGIDEPFVTDPRDMGGSRNLEDDQQRHHPGDNPQHCGAGFKALRVQHHGTAQNDLK